MGFRREPVFLVMRVFDSDSVEFLDLRLLDRRASSCTSRENLSAPVAREAKASPAVFAAAVPKAAANLRLDANAAIAICSPALIASSEETCLLVLDAFLTGRVLPRLRRDLERDELAIRQAESS